jgi:DNA-binding MarR family transcriptional regulator
MRGTLQGNPTNNTKHRSLISGVIEANPSDGAITEFRRSVTRLARLFSASMPKGELTPLKLSALTAIRRNGPMSAKTLAAKLGILPQSLTRIVGELEAAGLVKRSRGIKDTREHILDLTHKAVELMKEEGYRRDEFVRTAMERVLNSVEIDLLILAGKTINKLADDWRTGRSDLKKM